jgi:hypothetical protein
MIENQRSEPAGGDVGAVLLRRKDAVAEPGGYFRRSGWGTILASGSRLRVMG